MPPRAAVFDLDGTLADSAAHHAESWRLLAAELGAELADDWMRQTFGRANRDIIPDLLGRPAEPAEIARLSDRKEELYRALAATRLKLFPGALDLLRDLRAEGWRLGLGSSTPVANLEFTLPLLGLAELIEVYVGMEDVTRHKPEPDTFLEVARRLGVPPARCLAFEDAPAGVEAGVRAGMVPVAVTTHHPAAALAAAAHIRAGVWEISAADCAAWLNGKGTAG